MNEINKLIERINDLEKENAELGKWQASVNKMLDGILNLVSQISDNKEDKKVIENELRELWQYVHINRYRIDSLPYELQDPDYNSFFFKPHILSRKETIRQISEEGKSISRFGDGEFAAIVGQKRWNFQGESELLAARLTEVLASKDENLLIGLHPTFYMNLFDVPEEQADGVRAYMHPMVRKLHAQLLDKEKLYGNALFHNMESDEEVHDIKKIWDERDCIFIEGVHTGMGVGNDLFDNCKSIGRILGPAENAIDRYDEILNEALKQPKDKLMLLALGPTATVLAYDLYKNGYQAVDIGHADLIYEAYIRRSYDINKVEIPYKYCRVDECVEGRVIEAIDDDRYRRQIIAVIE